MCVYCFRPLRLCCFRLPLRPLCSSVNNSASDRIEDRHVHVAWKSKTIFHMKGSISVLCTLKCQDSLVSWKAQSCCQPCRIWATYSTTMDDGPTAHGAGNTCKETLAYYWNAASDKQGEIIGAVVLITWHWTNEKAGKVNVHNAFSASMCAAVQHDIHKPILKIQNKRRKVHDSQCHVTKLQDTLSWSSIFLCGTLEWQNALSFTLPRTLLHHSRCSILQHWEPAKCVLNTLSTACFARHYSWDHRNEVVVEALNSRSPHMTRIKCMFSLEC
jgi:hypothetical protein